MSNRYSWQQELQSSYSDLETILTKLQLTHTKLNYPINYQPKLPIKITKSFFNKIKKQSPQDPLLLQILPIKASNTQATFDPLMESQHNPIPGVLHKFKHRILITMTGTCAINCQYCFRQHFDYQANLPSTQHLQQIITYLKDNPNVYEVILSGGDPLIHNDLYLQKLINTIVDNTKVTTIRIHTRLPIVLPQRITNELMHAITGNKYKTVIVTHCNHAQELGLDNKEAFNKLIKHNITLLNQSVLLNHVNNNVDVLVDLSNKLFDYGVLPYYLHMLDLVSGSEYFQVPITTAQQLYQQLLAELPGYLVPKLVQEVSGHTHKVPIN